MELADGQTVLDAGEDDDGGGGHHQPGDEEVGEGHVHHKRVAYNKKKQNYLM